jgi:hypothetical protein
LPEITELKKMEESFLDKKELAFRGMAEYLEPELVQDLLLMGKFEDYCEEFYGFMDQMMLPVAWKDIEGKYMGGVKLFYQAAGLSCREDLIGKTDAELTWKAHASKFTDAARATLATHEHVSFDAKLKVAYGDGFDYFQVMAQENGCEIIVANQEHLSPQHEMVEDLMAIVHTFSYRLYGLRKYQKVLKESLENKEDLHESHANSE